MTGSLGRIGNTTRFPVSSPPAACQPPPSGPPSRVNKLKAKLFRRVRQQYRLGGIVGDAGGLEILDLRLHTVALADAVEPRAGIKSLGIGAAVPQIDAAGPAVLGVDELL